MAAVASNNNNTTTTNNNNNTINSNSNNNDAKVETNFAAEIFNAIATINPTENVIISPFILEATLALLYLGSDGKTAEELKQTLRLKRFSSNAKMANYYAENLNIATKETDTKIHLCNKILLLNENYKIAEEFRKISQKYFQTDTEKVTDLESIEKLRNYVNDAIMKITIALNCNDFGSLLRTSDYSGGQGLEIGNMSTIALLASNFQNKWFLPFSAYRSGIYEFHVATPVAVAKKPEGKSTNQTVAVPMLFDDDMFVKFGEFRELDARAIELPYEHDEEMAMLLVLPNKRDGFGQLLRQIRTVNLDALTEQMQMESVQVLLPKFKIDFEYGLRECLEEIGISMIFDKEANFKHLLQENCNENLRFANILHKVTIAVNESGSEASNVAAGNKPIVISNSIDSRKKFFRADHPFYFAIRCGNVTYFMGQVTNF